jgi:transcriptional regulator with XRE-family HTH domain
MFGFRLAFERKRLKLSQQRVADLLGLSRSAVGMIETDRAPLDAGRLLQLAGHGFDVLKVLTDEPGPVAAGRLLDWGLCALICERVDAWALSRGVSLPIEKKALIVKNLYLQFAARGQLDQAALDETLQMAA